MPQKTDTVERTQTDNFDVSNNRKTRSSEPPSWSEILGKFKRKFNLGSFGSKTLGYIAGALVLGFGTSLLPFLAFSIPGGWMTTIFIVTFLSSLTGKGDYLASLVAGGALVGTTALLSGAIFTFLFSAAFGAIAGVTGTIIGKKMLSDKV